MERSIGPEAFFLRGSSEKGVLLLHGFTGSPAEMRPLGDFLHRLGHTVYAPLLPGHGTVPEDLQEKTYQDYLKSSREGVHKLKEIEGINDISIIGLSLGGLLALALAEEGEGDRIAILCAPVWIQEKLGELARFLYPVFPYIKRSKKGFRIDGKLVYPGYQRMPVKALGNMLLFRNIVMKKLSQIFQPLLLIYSNAETTVVPKSADYIEKNAIHSKVRQIRLKESGHVVTLDKERKVVFQEISEFIEEELVCQK